MKNKKILSLLLATILPFTSQLGVVSSENVNDKLVSNVSNDEKMSNAERYFEWDPNIKVEWGKLYLINFEIDKQNWFFILELKDFTLDYTFLDPISKEKVVNVIPGTSDFRLYSYFDKDQEVVFNYETNFHLLNGNKSNLQNYLFTKADDYITLGEVADIIINSKSIDISNYYLKTKLLTLEDFEYNNTVPSKNDELKIKKEDFRFFIDIIEKDYQNKKFIFLKKVKEKDPQNFIMLDLFDDEKIVELKNNKFVFFKNSFNISEKKTSFTEPADISFWIPEYHRILRENTEIINGEEYYNVGMLRKLYENIPIENRYDYKDKLVVKPGSKDFVTDDADNTPDPLPYAELTIGSRGQDVLAMKQRFLELGYFRTTSFNDRFTDNTADTVRLFEKNNGLPVDGVADTVMLGVLFSGSAVGK